MDPLRLNPTAVHRSVWQDDADTAGIPLRMICPISLNLMMDPVVASDGYTYDAPMLRQLLQQQQPWPVSPMTRERLAAHFLPNGMLQREIGAMLEAHPHLGPPLSRQQKEAIEAAVARGIARHAAKATVLAAPLPDNADVDAYFREGLYALLPGQPLRHTSPRLETRLRRFILSDQPWAPTRAPAVELARRLRLPAPARNRHTGVSPRAPFTTGNLGWLEPGPLDLFLTAIHGDGIDDDELWRPLLDAQDDSESDLGPSEGEAGASAAEAFVAPTLDARTSTPLGSGTSITARTHSAPNPALLVEPAAVLPTPFSDNDESAWEPMDWVAETPPSTP